MLNPKTGGAKWSDEVFRIHDVKPADGVVTVERAIEMFEPADAVAIRKLIDIAAKTGQGFRLQLRLHTKNGSVRLVESIRAAVKDEDSSIKKQLASFVMLPMNTKHSSKSITCQTTRALLGLTGPFTPGKAWMGRLKAFLLLHSGARSSRKSARLNRSSLTMNCGAFGRQSTRDLTSTMNTSCSGPALKRHA